MPLDTQATQTEPVIKCSSVYKIFGENAEKMLREAKGQVDAKSFRMRAALSASKRCIVRGSPGRNAGGDGVVGLGQIHIVALHIAPHRNDMPAISTLTVKICWR